MRSLVKMKLLWNSLHQVNDLFENKRNAALEYCGQTLSGKPPNAISPTLFKPIIYALIS